MKNRGFTLLELLVVMGIMGLLGTIAMGGYRAMQRGMEERGVMQNVDSFIRAAYQRAQIDRQPTAIYFWNETIQPETSDKFEVAVGRAVAVRRYGRFSDVSGSYLIDEFADLDQTFQKQSDEEGGSGSGAKEASLFLYPMEKLGDIESSTQLKRTTVEGKIRQKNESVKFLTGTKNDENSGSDENKNEIVRYAFYIKDKGGVSWKPGMAYGMEFAYLDLPDNFIFGSSHSSSVDNPVQVAGTMVFDVGVNSGNGRTTGGTKGRNSIDIYSLRTEGAKLVARKVASSTKPEEDID